MPQEDIQHHDLSHTIREVVIYSIYGILVYRMLDNACDGAISIYVQNKWYRIKARYQSELEIRKETGKVIFQAMEVVENEG